MQCNDNFLPPESSYCVVLTTLFKYLFMGTIVNSHEMKISSLLYLLLFFITALLAIPIGLLPVIKPH